MPGYETNRAALLAIVEQFTLPWKSQTARQVNGCIVSVYGGMSPSMQIYGPGQGLLATATPGPDGKPMLTMRQ